MRGFLISLLIITVEIIAFSQNLVFQETSNSGCEWKCASLDEIPDFECVSKAIDRSQYLFLGEQSHGDGETFKAKIKLIEYLYLHKGFDVVLFESDVFGLNQDLVLNDQSIVSIDKSLENIYDIWTNCSDFTNYFLHNSTDEENKGIKISGFDSRMDLPFSQSNLLNYLDTSLNTYGFKGFNDSIKLIINDFEFVKDLRQTVKDSIKLSKLRTLVNRKVQALDSIGLQHTYLYLLLKNLNFNINWKNKTLAEMNVSSERDVQMAENLKWLLKNKYHGKKCIIWAANYHIANFSDNLTYTNYPETMMEVLKKDHFFDDKIYSIGFTSSTGSYSLMGKTVKIQKKRKKSLENNFSKDVTFAFEDCDQTHLIAIPIYGSFIGHFPIQAQWLDIFDGIFYIKEMKQCHVN